MGIVIPTVTHPIILSNKRHACTGLGSSVTLAPAVLWTQVPAWLGALQWRHGTRPTFM